MAVVMKCASRKAAVTCPLAIRVGFVLVMGERGASLIGAAHRATFTY